MIRSGNFISDDFAYLTVFPSLDVNHQSNCPCFNMKLFLTSFSLFSFAWAYPLVSSDASAAQPASVYSIDSYGSYAKPAGRLFNIDGKVQYFAGTNAWWLAHLSSNSDVDKSLAQMAATGYKIVRVWGFGDANTPPPSTNTDPNSIYFQILNSTGAYINYGADGLQRLDYVVHAASKYGLKLVLPFVNNWGDYGGIAAYTAAFNCSATTFFTDSVCQKVYKNYVKTIVTRYRSSTAIFAWELGNEPRCNGCATSVITNWATDISKYIKSLDSNHMVTLGDEGWFAPADNIGDGSYGYGGAEGVDWVANLKIKTLDYGVFHLYPNSWGYNYTWGNTWIEEHDAAAKAVGKPAILEEYGTPFPNNHTETEAPW
jgi:mannan endo-1,4-beta-mannosidase